VTRTVSSRPPYPGTPAVLDGSEAIASVEARLAEVASVCPISPSTGDPAVKHDWAKLTDGTNNDFLAFARTEGRFASDFAPDGTPSAEMLATQADRLANWRTLRELAGAA
jgi:hypothetical protein